MAPRTWPPGLVVQPLVLAPEERVCALRRLLAQTPNAHARDDLWVAGAMAVLDAARRFNAALGVPFGAFARRRIRGSMLDELRRLYPLPRRLRQRAEVVATRRRAISQAKGGEASSGEACAGLGLTQEHLASLDRTALPHLQLDVAELLPTQQPSPPECAEQQQARGALRRACNALPQQLQLVLSLRYANDLSNIQAAKFLGVSEASAWRLHKEAVRRMRLELRSKAP